MAAGRVLGALLAVALVAPGHAETIPTLEVTLEDGIYRTRAEVLLGAPLQRVWERLTDYAHLERLSPSIRSSEVLGRTEEGGYRVQVTAVACVLHLCKRMQQVQSIRQIGTVEMRGEVDPDLSDFSFGRVHWRLEPVGEATLLRFQAEMRPAFWIPPLIGSWLVKRALRQEVEGSAQNLERLAREGAP